MLEDTIRVPMQFTRGCLVVSLQGDMSGDDLQRMRNDLLAYVAVKRPDGVIMDASAIQMMDTVEWNDLKKTMAMASLMGPSIVLAGMNPGIVASLVELGAELEDFEGALNLDDAVKRAHELKLERSWSRTEEDA